MSRNREFIVLLGPSGCGKSTLLNAIAGLVDMRDGQIWIGGNNVTWEEPKDRGIAMVFQSYALYPRMTVRGNMSFGLQVAGMPPAEIARRVDSAAAMLQITDCWIASRPNCQAGSASASPSAAPWCATPASILFDEPLSNLDAKLRAELRVEIKRLHQRLGATMIYVTHDQIEALTLADRIAVMKDRVIQQLGTPQRHLPPAGEPLRGVLRRLAGDELPARHIRGARRRAMPSPPPGQRFRSTAMASMRGRSQVQPSNSAFVPSMSRREAICRPRSRWSSRWEATSWPGCDWAAIRSRCGCSADTPIASGQSLQLRLPPDKLNVFDAASGRRL